MLDIDKMVIVGIVNSTIPIKFLFLKGDGEKFLKYPERRFVISIPKQF
jgi:hypothetical protein